MRFWCGGTADIRRAMRRAESVWEALRAAVGTATEQILRASQAKLAGALKAGGMVKSCARSSCRRLRRGCAMNWAETCVGA